MISPKAKHLMKEFENAVKEYAFIGGLERADDRAEVMDGYREATADLVDYIIKIEGKGRPKPTGSRRDYEKKYQSLWERVDDLEKLWRDADDAIKALERDSNEKA